MTAEVVIPREFIQGGREAGRQGGGRGVRVSSGQATDTGGQALREFREYLRAGKTVFNFTWTSCFRGGARWSPL